MTVEVRKVKIASGGTLTMMLEDANPLKWTKTDRVWFFGIVDALIAYEETIRQESNLSARKLFDDIRKSLESAQSADAVDPHADNPGNTSTRA